MTLDLGTLSVFTAGFPPAALKSAIATALEEQFPEEPERKDLASLVAAWLRVPHGEPPPLSVDAIERIYRHLTGRAH